LAAASSRRRLAVLLPWRIKLLSDSSGGVEAVLCTVARLPDSALLVRVFALGFGTKLFLRATPCHGVEWSIKGTYN